jgi:hypothetical protein
VGEDQHAGGEPLEESAHGGFDLHGDLDLFGIHEQRAVTVIRRGFGR